MPRRIGPRVLEWIGPGFITASVVLGPGSITTVSKAGAAHGYALLWVPVAAAAFMAGFIVLSMRFGIRSRETFLGCVARIGGRPLAILAGLSMFYVTAAFQFGNNTGLMTAMEGLAPSIPPVLWALAFNAGAMGFLFGPRRIYRVLERAMIALVAVMVLAFFANLAFARPRLAGLVAGFVPRVPSGADPVTITAIVATTFTIVAAIGQAYLVRSRGWGEREAAKGVADSLSASAMLLAVNVVILVTSAAVLHPEGIRIKSAADMAFQLARLFGPFARGIFCVGLAAAAFSSFLVNAILGGMLLADGLGLEARVDARATRGFAALVLLAGMAVAIAIRALGILSAVDALVFGQAGTLLAVPLGAILCAVVFFRTRAIPDRVAVPGRIFVLAGAGVLLLVSGITAARLVGLV